MSEEHHAPDAFAFVENLLTLVTDQAAVKRRLHSLHDSLAAVDTAQRELAAERTKFSAEQAAARAALAAERLELDARMDGVIVAEGQLAERERWVAALQLEWKFVGEPDLVKSGLQAPLYGTALEKARRAFGISDAVVTAPAPPPLRPSFLDTSGEPFPAHVSVTRSS